MALVAPGGFSIRSMRTGGATNRASVGTTMASVRRADSRGSGARAAPSSEAPDDGGGGGCGGGGDAGRLAPHQKRARGLQAGMSALNISSVTQSARAASAVATERKPPSPTQQHAAAARVIQASELVTVRASIASVSNAVVAMQKTIDGLARTVADLVAAQAKSHSADDWKSHAASLASRVDALEAVDEGAAEEIGAVGMRTHWVTGTVLARDGVDVFSENDERVLHRLPAGTDVRLIYPTMVTDDGCVWMTTPVIDAVTAEIQYARVCVALGAASGEPAGDEDDVALIGRFR